MARAAAQRRKRPKPDARKRRDSGGARLEDTLFFARLRKQVRWVYIFLAVVFAAGFVFLGVGSGSSGIGDLLQGNFDFFGRSSSSGPSEKDAREKIDKNPQDAAAYRELSTALQAKGKTDEAITALERYRALRPKDVEALRELASLYLQKADTFRRRAVVAQSGAGAAFAYTEFQPANKIGEALTDPIFDALSTKANVAVSDAITKEQDAYRQAIGVYQSISKANPSDPTVQLELAQAAESASDVQTAIGAYKKFIELAPDDPSVPAIKQRIKQLQSPTLGATPSG